MTRREVEMQRGEHRVRRCPSTLCNYFLDAGVGAGKILFQQLIKRENGHQTKMADKRFGIMELGIWAIEKCQQTQ
jgi:hypothetical protein